MNSVGLGKNELLNISEVFRDHSLEFKGVFTVFPVVTSAASESGCCFSTLVRWPLALVQKWTMGATRDMYLLVET